MIWLARHGETTWNLAGRYQGRLESSLSPLGVRQAAALAEHFAAQHQQGERVPTRILASPLGRCTQTARAAAQRLGLAVETDERLIEIAHGTWEGRLKSELARDDPERYVRWSDDPAHVEFPGGESLHDVALRWYAAAADFTLLDARDTLVVTHDAVIRCALLTARGRSFEHFWDVRVENGAYAVMDVDDGRLTVTRECVADFLGDLRSRPALQAL